MRYLEGDNVWPQIIPLEIEYSFEELQRQRIELVLLYRAFVHGEDDPRSPWIYAGIVYNTQYASDRHYTHWVFMR